MKNPDQKIAAAFVAYVAVSLVLTAGMTGFMVWAIFQIVTNNT